MSQNSDKILNSSHFFDPSLLILYQHLKADAIQMRIPMSKISKADDSKFIYQTAACYERIGCPTLALFIIQENYSKKSDDKDSSVSSGSYSISNLTRNELESSPSWNEFE